MTTPLLDRLRKRVPSPQNHTCECAGDKQCDACLIKEAMTEIEQLELIAKVKDRFSQADEWQQSIDKQTIDVALFFAGKQWGNKTTEDIIESLKISGFEIVRRK